MSASTAKKLATRVSLILAAAALFVPIKLTSEGRVQQNEACASGNCCKEINSICDVGELVPNAYWSGRTCKPTLR